MWIEDKMWNIDKDGDIEIHLPAEEDYTLYLTRDDLLSMLEKLLDYRGS